MAKVTGAEVARRFKEGVLNGDYPMERSTNHEQDYYPELERRDAEAYTEFLDSEFAEMVQKDYFPLS